jgi:hypothetical protein
MILDMPQNFGIWDMWPFLYELVFVKMSISFVILHQAFWVNSL